MRNINSYDLLGSVAVVKFPLGFKKTEKKKWAEKLLKERKSVKSVLEKKGRIKGRLRKISTAYLAGEKTKEVLYRENNCIFRFNIDATYFSPRLSNERKEIASAIKKGDEVLVMFAGVAPFPVVIAKNSKAGVVVSNEINREANKYAELNIELNKVKDKVVLLPGDIKRVAEKVSKGMAPPSNLPVPPPQVVNSKKITKSKISPTKLSNIYKFPRKYDVIVMPRPQLKETFLKQAFMLSKKGTRIYYYDFCRADETNLIVKKIRAGAKKYKKMIKILKIKSAGEIAPYKIRVRIDFRIL